MRSRHRSAQRFFWLVAGALIGLAGATTARAQPLLPTPTPLPAPAAQPAKSPDPVEPPTPPQVFPEGDFPTFPPAPEGGIPAATPIPKPGTLPPPVLAPTSDYPSYGYGPQEGKDAPGAREYIPLSGPMPGYVYETSYYATPGIGARALADYAPPGYEPREFQDAPGAPEFVPIYPPAPITPEERQKFVTRGLFPGSYLVPGTNTSFRFRGFVRLTGLYDFDPIGSRDDFVTSTIPVPQRQGQNYNMAARYSRFALETWTPTTIFEWN